MAQDVLRLLLAPAAGLAANVLLYALLAALIVPLRPIRLQLACFAVGAALTAALLAVMLDASPFGGVDRAGYFALHFLVYACFGFGVFNVVSASVSSLRVRILKEMLRLDPAPIGAEALRGLYSARDILAFRLARLQASGHVVLRDGRYHLQRGGLTLIGYCFTGLRRLLLGA
jgi:hypothetical protein